MAVTDALLRILQDYPSTLPLLGIAILVGYAVYQVVIDPLRSVPGPFLARFTRLWELYQLRKDHFEQVNIELHRKYGPVVRIAPGRYSIDDRVAVKQIYGHGSKFLKGAFYHPFGDPAPERANLFNDRNEKRHAAERRKVANLYSMSTLVSYESFVDKCTALLHSKFEAFSTENKIIDIPTWTQYYAFDVIGEITVAKSFDMLERGTDHLGILETIGQQLMYGSHIGLVPELHNWIPWLGAKLGRPSPFTNLMNFINTQLDLRKCGKNKSDRSDFLTKLLKMKEEGASGVDSSTVFDTVGSNIAAGSDTTGITLAATIYYLETNHDCKAKLREEIDRCIADGTLSDPCTFKETQAMPYLQAILKEALRIHPATGQPMSRIVPDGGAELTGHFFPAGMDVGVNSWVLHRNKAIFGEDADDFRPERWTGSKEDVSVMNENMFAFGAGSRTCIGKNISLLEMAKVISQVYRKFDFEMVDSHWTTENRWFVKQKFKCKVRRRSA